MGRSVTENMVARPFRQAHRQNYLFLLGGYLFIEEEGVPRLMAPLAATMRVSRSPRSAKILKVFVAIAARGPAPPQLLRHANNRR